MNKSFKIITILFLITCLFFITSCHNQSDKATYTVTFKDYDGTLLKEEIIEEGTAATPPENPERDGYTFTGWSEEYTNIQKDTIIIALYKQNEPVKYTVTFITNSSAVIDPILALENQTINEPSTPIKEGYIFDGWYLNNQKWNFTTYKVTTNITLVAKWTQEQTLTTYKITYELNGGIAQNPETYQIGDEITLNNPTNKGYTFTGWTTPENNIPYLDITIANETKDLHFIANWSNLEFTLKENNEYEITRLINNDDTKILIPAYYDGKKVTSIEQSAFVGCYNLTNVYYNGTIENWCNLKFNNPNNHPMSYAENFYLKNESSQWELLTEIIIPDTVTEIGKLQFYRFSNITKLQISNNTRIINDLAFDSCRNLTTVIFEENSQLTNIGSSAFGYCTSLTSIDIPSSITNIGREAFSGCEKLTSINVDDNNLYYQSIDGNLYSKDGRTLIQYLISKQDSNFNIPNRVTSIKTSAFSNCYNLLSITIPDSVVSIEDFAFEYCSSLIIYCETTSIPSGWKSNWKESDCPAYFGINENNFIEIDKFQYILDQQNKTAILSRYIGTEEIVEIPSTITHNNIEYNVTQIGDKAFYNCRNIINVTIGENITTIGSKAFYFSTLKWIYISKNVVNMSAISLNGINGLVIYTEYKENEDFEGFQHSTHQIYYGVNENNFVEINNIQYILDLENKTASVSKYIGNDKQVEIPESIEYNNENYNIITIAKNAFFADNNIENVIIGNNVTNIDEYAFYDCQNLKNIEMGINVKNIGNYAFTSCESLTNIKIPNTVINIGNQAFSSCENLTSIIIPDSVLTIGYGTFYYCKNLTIYCETSSLPSGWDSSWNKAEYGSSNYITVVWGYKTEK